MNHLTREKAALIFFIFLICFGLGISLFYISKVSQPLNVAAANIDDATGGLDGYTAIVYEGLAEEELDSSDDKSESKASEELNRKSQDNPQEDSEEVTASDALSNQEETDEAKEAVTVEGIKKSYIEKGASVFELDVANSEVYATRSVVRAGKYTFGMISATEAQGLTGEALEEYLQKRVKEYKDANVDFVILVVDNLSMLLVDEKTEDDKSVSAAPDTMASRATDSASDKSSTISEESNTSISDVKESKREISLKGIQIVVSKKNEGLRSGGVIVDGIFYNDASLKGEVGTLLVSPSKVVSAKDIS